MSSGNPHIFKICGWKMGFGAREEMQSVGPKRKVGMGRRLV